MFPNRLVSLLASLFVLGSSSVSAIPISGGVAISAATELNGPTLGTSTGAYATTGIVMLANGAFAGTKYSLVSYSAFDWAPSSAPVANLWTFTKAGLTYSFDLTSLTYTNDGRFLDISGVGVLSITGVGSVYDPTEGSWTYQVTSANGQPIGGQFVFQSTLHVPEQSGPFIPLLTAAFLIAATKLRGLSIFR